MKISGMGAPLEQLTITIEPTEGNQGTLKIAWEQTVAATDIVVH